jgi:hypothetical protein
MNFITLTSYVTGRTLHVRVDRIYLVSTYINDETREKYTRVWLGDMLDGDLHVVETPEEVMQRISTSITEQQKQTILLEHIERGMNPNRDRSVTGY